MPERSDALDFVLDNNTSPEQLRRACAILGLETGGTHEEMKTRLLAFLHALDEHTPVVCLNPHIPPETA